MSYHKVWFINFSGIGNGIMIIPVLACFEKSYPAIKYFHTYNDILANTWFLKKGCIRNLIGLSNSNWRRFKKEDWFDILDYIKKNNIDLIINLRNEGPHCDIDYYDFKKYVSLFDIELDFWDLDFDEIEHRKIQKNLTGDILKMMNNKGVDISEFNNHWLKSIRESYNCIHGIGLCITASQYNKRWPKTKWSTLIKYMLDKKFCQEIIIFPGRSKNEQQESEELCALNLNVCSFVARENLKEIAEKMKNLKCFVSNDTGLLHMAVSIGIPTIGLYTSTDPIIWGPYDNNNFNYFINSHMYKCPYRKIHCGNCLNYYDVCPAIEKYGDDIDPKKVFQAVKTSIKNEVNIF